MLRSSLFSNVHKNDIRFGSECPHSAKMKTKAGPPRCSVRDIESVIVLAQVAIIKNGTSLLGERPVVKARLNVWQKRSVSFLLAEKVFVQVLVPAAHALLVIGAA